MSLYDTGQLIRICVDRVMCLSEHSSIHVHACFQLSLSCLICHEHRRSTLTLSAIVPLSSAEVRGLVIHDMKEVEGVRQQEEQEDKRD